MATVKLFLTRIAGFQDRRAVEVVLAVRIVKAHVLLKSASPSIRNEPLLVGYFDTSVRILVAGELTRVHTRNNGIVGTT